MNIIRRLSADKHILAAGEIGLDTELNKLKMGDGTTAWSDLPFLGEGKDELKEKLKSMLLLRYVEMLREELGRTIVPSDMYGSEPKGWSAWKDEHGITSQPADDHVELPWMRSSIYVPKDFADKALVLDYMP